MSAPNTNGGGGDPFAKPRSPGPDPQPDIEKFGHEGMRGFIMRIGQPKVQRNFTHDMMASIKRGTYGS